MIVFQALANWKQTQNALEGKHIPYSGGRPREEPEDVARGRRMSGLM